jgi:hypothetical protein
MRGPAAEVEARAAPALSWDRLRRELVLVPRPLAAAGVALVALYLVLSRRMSLWEYFPGPGVSLAFPGMLGPNWPRNAVLYVAVVVLAFALFGVAAVAVWRNRHTVPYLVLAGFPLLFFLALFWMYPPSSMDLFHYQADARTLWVHNQNPLTVPPSAHPYPIGIVWPNQPSPYGPLWSLLTFFATVPFGDHFTAGLFAFKALAAVFYAGCGWLIVRIARDIRPGWERVALVLFAWNPFVVLRVFGNGSNDLVMMFFALLALDRARRRDWLLAFPAIAASLLVKYVTAVLGPLLLVYAWTHTPGDVRQRLRAIAPGLALALGVVVLCYAPFWEGEETLRTLERQANNHMVTSIPLLVWVRLKDILGPDDATGAALRITRLLYLLLYVPLLWEARRDYVRLLSSCFNALFLYLVVACAWLQMWYFLWPLAIAALLPGTWLTAMLLAISFFVSFPDLIEQYKWNIDWLQSWWRSVSFPVLVMVWLPLLVWYFGLVTFRSWHFDLPFRARQPTGTPQ